MKNLLLVFLGGGLGSSLRYLVSHFLNNTNSTFPYGTFAVNVFGSLCIGIILSVAAKHQAFSQNTVLFLATGFCGGFTTFSTFAYENHLLLKSGDFLTFTLYTMGSLILGFGAVFLGIWLGKYF